MDEIAFRSKIDLWLLLVLLAGIAMPLAITALALPWPSLGVGARVFVGLVVLSAVALPLWLLGSTSYRFDANTLHIRSGPFAWRVPLAQVRDVSPTRSALSSPALSLDRLRIRFGERDEIMISPAERERFLAALQRRAPQARIGR